MPVISVVVPVYKVEPYIHRCVDSLLGQSYADFELILVEDGSPDDCGRICDEYAVKDSRVHVIHQENGGLSAARNAGIDWACAHSDSQWLAFVDSDDWVHSDYLRVLLSAAERCDAAIATCMYKRTDEVCRDDPVENLMPIGMDPEQAYAERYSMCMTVCCKIFAKRLFSGIRFPVGKLHEDAFVSHLLTFGAERVAVCDTELYYYYNNQQSLTRAKWSERRLDQIEAHELRLQYMQDRGYKRALIVETGVYTEALFEQLGLLMELCKDEKSYEKYLVMLRKKAMPALRQAKSYGLFPRSREYGWLYERAFLLKKPVWPVYRLLRKVKNSLR